VAVLSREEFDAIEFDAVRSGDHASAAELMNQLAVTATETAGMARAEAFLRAGEQYLMADDPVAAAGGFRRAMADGGPVFVDARVPLARALFQLGRQAEAQALIAARDGKPAGPVPDQPQGSDDESELRLLLSLRYRIRNDLGLPEDTYDGLLDEA
jgi:hypothetical protein